MATSKRELARIWKAADEAGREAVRKTVPTPMVVVEHANPLDDSSPVVHRYPPVEGGVCGFAWINTPGNRAFGRWVKETGRGRPDSYYGGVTIWVSDFGQSYERKDAYAQAFARVLNENGVTAYAMGRLD